jgi:hypothetical protein
MPFRWLVSVGLTGWWLKLRIRQAKGSGVGDKGMDGDDDIGEGLDRNAVLAREGTQGKALANREIHQSRALMRGTGRVVGVSCLDGEKEDAAAGGLGLYARNQNEMR